MITEADGSESEVWFVWVLNLLRPKAGRDVEKKLVASIQYKNVKPLRKRWSGHSVSSMRDDLLLINRPHCHKAFHNSRCCKGRRVVFGEAIRIVDG